MKDYMASVHPVGPTPEHPNGIELPTKLEDGWRLAGTCIRETEDGEGRYLLARWERTIRR